MHRFTVVYPDHSRQKVNRTRRDEMLAAGALREKADGQYFYIGQASTFHALSDLGRLGVAATGPQQSFLPGQFIVELKTNRTKELMETPYHMALRLATRSEAMQSA